MAQITRSGEAICAATYAAKRTVQAGPQKVTFNLRASQPSTSCLVVVNRTVPSAARNEIREEAIEQRTEITEGPQATQRFAQHAHKFGRPIDDVDWWWPQRGTTAAKRSKWPIEWQFAAPEWFSIKETFQKRPGQRTIC
jgi:hypothetical protein